MDKSYLSTPLLLILIGYTVFYLGSANAEPGNLKIGVSSEYTDNTRLSATHEVEDFKRIVSLEINKRDRFGRLDSYVVGDVEYYSYINNTYSSDLDSNIRWEGTFHIRPQALIWDLSNEISEVIIDSTEATTPDNRTTRNIFATGPIYTVNFGKTDFATFTGEYQNVDYKTAGDDNNRNKIVSSYTHLLSDHQQLTASYDWSNTHFDNDREVYRKEVLGKYRYRYLNYSIDASYGMTDLKGRNATSAEDTNSSTWDAMLKIDVSRTSSFGLTYSRELNDTASGIDLRFDDAVVNLTESAVLLLTEWSIFYKKSFSNGSEIDAKIYYDSLEYLIGGSDEQRNIASMNYSYPLNNRLIVEVDAEYQRIDFFPSARSDDRIDVSINSGFEYIRGLFFNVDIGYQIQDSNSASNDYKGSTVIVSVRYAPTL